MKKYLQGWLKTIESVVCIFLLSTAMIIVYILASLFGKYETIDDMIENWIIEAVMKEYQRREQEKRESLFGHAVEMYNKEHEEDEE